MYPDSPGFAPNSDTSRQAADELVSRERIAAAVLDVVEEAGSMGVTVDEARQRMENRHRHKYERTDVAARFTELEQAGRLAVLPEKRKSQRTNKNVNVYVLAKWAPYQAAAKASETATETATPLERARDLQARIGHGYVVPRADGKKSCNGPQYCQVCRQVDAYMQQLGAQERAAAQGAKT